MRRPLLVLAAALVSLATPSAGQTLARNPQGDWVLTYTDLTDTARTLVIEAMDQVQPALTVQVSASGGSYSYRYALTNGPAARRTIHVLDLLCPAGDPTLTVGAPPSWYAHAEATGKLDGAQGLSLCSYSHRPGLGDLVAPGGMLSDLQITSSWLPGTRTARVYGLVPMPVLPSVAEDTPDTVVQLLERA